MRLLITTQKVDSSDNVLGFFYHWLLEFSRHVESLTVICLEEGVHSLPNNVRVLSLGKKRYKLQTTDYKLQKRLLYVLNFYKHIWRHKNEYDAVFVHMNPEYVALGGFLWRLWRKKIGLWYVHRQVNLKLRIAEKLAHVIFSTTPEAFRLKSKKVYFLGHGIDFSLFPQKQSLSTPDVGKFEIVHVGRITPIKNLDILIEAAAILKRIKNKEVRIKIVGRAGRADDVEYEKHLKGLVKKLNIEDGVSFVGDVPFSRIGEMYKEADLSVNLTPTGGMDKAVLESIASGTAALSANRAFADLFGEYKERLLYNERDAEDTARKIKVIMDMELRKRREMEVYLYKRAKERFDLHTLISRVIHELQQYKA